MRRFITRAFPISTPKKEVVIEIAAATGPMQTDDGREGNRFVVGRMK
jgi:hypothetical protein